MMDVKDVILRVLDVIDYQEDKSEFVKEFEAKCLHETVLELLKELPPKGVSEINEYDFEKEPDINLFTNIIGKYMDKETVQNKLAYTYAVQTQYFINSIKKETPPDRRDDLLLVLFELRRSLNKS